MMSVPAKGDSHSMAGLLMTMMQTPKASTPAQHSHYAALVKHF